MHQARGGMGSKKHGTSGHATKSPRLRFALKLAAERDERKDRSKIKQPFNSLREMLKGK